MGARERKGGVHLKYAVRKNISLFGAPNATTSCDSWSHSWYLVCVGQQKNLYNFRPAHFLFGAMRTLINIYCAGVTGRPIRLPQLEPKPLRSHQLSNTKSPGGSIIDPTDPLVVVGGEREKKNLEIHKHFRSASMFPAGSTRQFRWFLTHLDGDAAHR